ncbi:MAG: hypothetical protein JXA03_00440 [Bacteroidales bacterium]|nr:hypothetical protein [Bacteroidales bacterium]
MDKKIFLLTDYHNHFGAKYRATPYRSGMDKTILAEAFARHQAEAVYLPFSEVNTADEKLKGNFVLYSSSEHKGNNYKKYIEDIVYALELAGARTVPQYRFLLAHNNKVFMEQLRNIVLGGTSGIQSRHFGTLEELEASSAVLNYPCVLKSASGSLSKGVFLAQDAKELVRLASKISRTPHLRYELKDFLRRYKHKGYMPESRFQGKFIVQNFVPDLPDDWKILIFGNRAYALNRKIRTDDFRASGSGKLSYRKDLPEGILDFSWDVFQKFGIPFLSLDVACKGSNFYLIEFQAIFFGTYTLDYSPFYWEKTAAGWEFREEKSILEDVYAESVVKFVYGS